MQLFQSSAKGKLQPCQPELTTQAFNKRPQEPASEALVKERAFKSEKASNIRSVVSDYPSPSQSSSYSQGKTKARSDNPVGPGCTGLDLPLLPSAEQDFGTWFRGQYLGYLDLTRCVPEFDEVSSEGTYLRSSQAGHTPTVSPEDNKVERDSPQRSGNTTPRITLSYIRDQLRDSESESDFEEMDRLRPDSALAMSQHRKEAVRLAKVQEMGIVEKCKRINTVVPGYSFEELIGKGSFGRVYKW